MEPGLKISAKTPSPSKRLLFDNRYGFVFDEWKEPSEVALACGRGMYVIPQIGFCIVPLGKALWEKASESINLAASCTIEALEKPDRFSAQMLQANLSNHLHKLMSSTKKTEPNIFGFNGKFSFPLKENAEQNSGQ